MSGQPENADAPAVATTLPPARPPAGRLGFHGDSVAASVVILFIVLQLWFAFFLNINWDEYYFLSQIYDFRMGRLAMPMQTFHVELLEWLTALPLSEPDQIVVGRVFMLACEGGMLACLYAIGRTWFAPRAMALALAAYVTSGWVLGHGVSFRTDALAAFLIAASLALMFRARDWPAMLIAGALAAIALLVTIKAAFWLPAFAAAFIWRSREHGIARTAGLFAAATAALLAVGAGAWLFHTTNLAMPAGNAAMPADLSAASQRTAGYFDRLMGSQPWFPRWGYIRSWLMLSAIPVVLVVGGVIGAVRGGDRLVAVVLGLLVVPVFSLALYRNAFPYFFPFIFAPACLAAAAADRMLGAPVRFALTAAMAIGLGAQAFVLMDRDQSAQRQIAAAAHQIFPDPVPYIDRNSMLPSFPKVGYFMSTWGVDDQRATGRPALKPVIETHQPPLVIANSPQLVAAFGLAADTEGRQLLDEDAQALRENYVHHWGPIWVAGKRLTVAPEGGQFELAIPGRYTIECSGRLTIDGVQRACGTVVSLATGQHLVSARRPTPLLLRWGDHLLRPSIPEPTRPIYYGF